MVCGKCGAELSSNSAYCLICGAKQNVQEEKKVEARRSKEKMIQIVSLLLSVVLFACFLIFGINYLNARSVYDSQVVDGKIDTLTILSNNLQNGGYITTDGEVLFYCANGGICRYEPEKDEVTAFVEEVFYKSTELYYYGDKLYWRDGFDIVCANGELTNEHFLNDRAVSFAESDSLLYYQSWGNQPRLSVKESQDDEGRIITNIPTDEIYRYGPYLYISSREKPLQGLWRVELDGTNRVRILNEAPKQYVISGNKLYYVLKNALYSANIDGTDVSQYTDVSVQGGLNISGSTLFYIDEHDHNLYRMDTNGKTRKLLAEGKCFDPIIIGEWVYYIREIDTFEKSIYKVKLDGTENHLFVDQ